MAVHNGVPLVCRTSRITVEAIHMEYFVGNERLVQLEAALAAARGARRLGVLVELAWQLRQRDTNRALVLADEADSLLADMGLSATEIERTRMRMRLLLVRAEAALLFGGIDTGMDMTLRALQGFAAIADPMGCTDAHSLMAWVAYDRGDAALNHVHAQAMFDAAQACDPVRQMVARAALALEVAFRDVGAASHILDAHLNGNGNGNCNGGTDVAGDSAAAGWVEYFFGTVAGLSGDYVSAVRHFSKCHMLALAYGQIRVALGAAIGVGDAFNNLNDHQSALEWMERGLQLARPSRWPVVGAIALNATAETLRRLQRYDAAHEMLQEALAMMAPMSGSRNYAVTLRYLAELDVNRTHYGSALGNFQLLEQRAIALSQADLLFASLRGQAHALYELGQALPALLMAQRALAEAKANPGYQINALRVIADMYVRYPLLLPPPPGIDADGTPLYYLQQALDLCATIKRYNVPGDFLDAMAREHAKLGDFERAFQIGQQASQARERIYSQQTVNRANAMQLSHRIEEARIEAGHHRQLAAVEAQRAGVLQQTSETLEHLGAIGQEITGHLDAERVFQVLNRHVQHLLDVSALAIYRIDADGRNLNSIFGFEYNQALPSHCVSLSSATSDAVRCVRERREILVDQALVSDNPNLWPSNETTHSCLFAPLCVADQVIGVMTIQSLHRHAYGPRERLIFRTLCAYTAIALANAESLLALRLAQAQLLQQEKMASLGGLVAGFAHQLNTPIAAVKSSGKSTIDAFNDTLASLPPLWHTLDQQCQPLFISLVGHRQHQSGALSTRAERAQVRKLTPQLAAMGVADAAHAAFIVVQLRAFAMIERITPLLRHPDCGRILQAAYQFSMIANNANNIVVAADRMANIILALKSLADMDQPSLLAATPLNGSIDAALAPHRSQMQNKVRLLCDYQDIAPLPCMPDQIRQVWANLIHNALQAMHYQGTLSIGVSRQGGEAVVTVTDTGAGVAELIRERIFEPFFTTKAVGEGSGLGLAIVKKIIDRHRGRIMFDSAEGDGSTFTVCLPYD
jgi:signal transduction histidine kinase